MSGYTINDSFTVDIPNGIVTLLQGNRIPHALCIEGAKGTGVAYIAKAVAASVICESDSGLFCGECRHCRKVMSDVHPDVIIMDGADSEQSKIGNIRTFLENGWVEANEAAYKVLIILNADQIKPDNQNVLLKAVEDPPGNTFFVLTCTNRYMFLPTILSRISVVKADPPTKETCIQSIEAEIPGRERQEYEMAAKLAGNCPGECIRILTDPDYLRMNNNAYKLLESVSNDKPCSAIMAASPYEKSRADQLQFMELVAGMLANHSITDELGIGYDELAVIEDNMERIFDLAKSYGYQPMITVLLSEIMNKRSRG